jgi:hypothetical protein
MAINDVIAAFGAEDTASSDGSRASGVEKNISVLCAHKSTNADIVKARG